MSNAMQDLKGKIAFITGGASGIGLAIAQALADEGARVVLADIDAVQLEFARTRVSGDPLPIMLDVSDRAAWSHAKDQVEARLGPVDILCNNAGIGGDGMGLAHMHPDAFDRMIRICLTGTFNGIHTFVAGMIQRGCGHIVNTASLAGLIHPPTIGAYCAAKAAVVALSESLRAEAGAAGVGVTALCPGTVRTRIDETTRKAGSARPERSALPSLSTRTLDPSAVGSAVVDAIRRNYAYLITHWEFRQPFEARIAAVFEAFDRAAQLT
jgi:NAD(P)-dependent dehydrogenase (short-subunit alcohol dehydrogenase family)